jgi:hypothetical protein
VLDTCARQILRYAQDDKLPGCHPERSLSKHRLAVCCYQADDKLPGCHPERSLSKHRLAVCCYQADDKLPGCHPERSEGSLADFWGITREKFLTLIVFAVAQTGSRSGQDTFRHQR